MLEIWVNVIESENSIMIAYTDILSLFKWKKHNKIIYIHHNRVISS